MPENTAPVLPSRLRDVRLTDFEKSVLRATLEIPLGETRSYKWIAQRVGRPAAVRAVGQALRKNPYPLLVPCHRVVKSDGSPGAYAGKYDGRKEDLLRQEQDIRAALSLGADGPTH